ncbi:MAG: PAS domain S-box protein [Methanoregula sp.]|nr:PAS domain S-box protein [Methanoregula sp.]
MDKKNVIQTVPQLKSMVAALTQLLEVQEKVVSGQSEDLKKNLGALQESREKYRELVETTGDWVWEVDEKGAYTYASPQVRDQIGYTPEEVLGKTPFDFMPPKEAARVGETFMKIVTSQQPFSSLENANLHKDGRIVILETSGVPVFRQDGQFGGYRGIDRDITERKRAEEEIHKAHQGIMEHDRFLQRLIDTIPNPIFYKDKNGIYIGCNTAFEGYIGLSKDQLIGKSVYDIAPKDLADIYYATDRKLLDNHGLQTYESRVKYADGSIHDVIFNKATFTDLEGNVDGLVGVIVDITGRKQAEAELKKYSVTLEDMVTERTKELREAQEQLVTKEKLAVLGKLAGGVGHELRNPLGAIKNAAYFLNMVLENPEPDVKETLEIMTREVARSEDILSSLLDFARPTVLTIRKVRINDVIAEAVARNPIPENITLTRTLDDTLPDIMADPDKLLQVFTNLITNACQAMPGGGTLAVTTMSPAEDRVSVSVRDTGTGITEEHMKRLFEPLFSTKAKGIGLGLVVTKAIVEAHQGSIDVRSEAGKGTTFTVTLPVGIKGGS